MTRIVLIRHYRNSSGKRQENLISFKGAGQPARIRTVWSTPQLLFGIYIHVQILASLFSLTSRISLKIGFLPTMIPIVFGSAHDVLVLLTFAQVPLINTHVSILFVSEQRMFR